MGAYLSAPITDKEAGEGENDYYAYGVASMQGWRTDQEDAHTAVLTPGNNGDPRTAIFAVFDGHGGREVSKFCAAHLPQELSQTEGFRDGDLGQALTNTFLRMDELLVKDEYREELKAFKGSDEEEEKEGAPMVINGASLPESLLEALGLQGSGSGFQIKLVRSGPGGRQISIDDIEEEGAEEEEEEGSGEEGEGGGKGAAEVEPSGMADSGEGGAAAGAAEGEGEEEEGPERDLRRSESEGSEGRSKRKREEVPMDSEGGGAASEPAVPAEGEAGPSGGDAEAGGAEAAGDGAVVAAVVQEEAVEMAEEVIEEYSTPPRDENEYAGPNAGCTAVCAVIRGNELYVANAGDSRCILCRNGKAVPMTQDHKPTDAEEYDRIIKAGGFVADGRVNGSLNLSRAIGDLEYKQTRELGPGEQMVTALPEVRKETLQSGDSFLILACDGIWDVLTNQEAVDFVQERLLQGKAPKQICEEACDHCLAPDTAGCGKGCDNMSIQVVLLKPFAQDLLTKAAAGGSGSGAAAAQAGVAAT